MHLPTTQPTWLPEDGVLLQSLRQKAGIDALVFARLNTISTAQLKELETGVGNSFYNAQIKRSTGFKLLRSLGHVEVVQAPAQTTTLADAADSPDLVLQTPIDRPIETAWRAAEPAPGSPTAQVKTRIHALQPLYLALAFIVLAAVVFIGREWTPKNNVLSHPQPHLSDVIMHPATTGAATLTAVQAPPNKAAQNTPNTAEPGPSDQVSANSPALTDAAIAMPRPTTLAPVSCLNQHRQSSVTHTPTAPLRAGDYIFFEALENSQLCVLDAQNQLTTVQLDAGMKRRVNGEAPFLVHTSNWQHLKMFYQGRRVQTGDNIQQHMVLKSQFFAP
jgi:hypothetical protein